jgi:Flp pilus assembly protein TadG
MARSRKGSVLVLVALALTSLIAMAGLVIDGGYIYLIRQKSQNAADAAALTAAYNVSTGKTLSYISLSAQHAADLNNMGGLPATVVVNTPFNGNAQLAQVVNLTSVQPFFLSVLGVKSIAISDSAVAQAPGGIGTIGNFDVVVAMDRSSSFAGNYQQARTGALQILNSLRLTYPQNQFSFVTFNGHGNVRTNFLASNASFNSLKTSINAVKNCDEDDTCSGSDLASGLETALNMFTAPGYTKTTGAGQAVLFISDGAASVSNTETQYHALGDNGDNNRAIADAKNAFLKNGIQIYSILFEDPGFTNTDFNTMANIANGGNFLTVSSTNSFASQVGGAFSTPSTLKLVQ